MTDTILTILGLSLYIPFLIQLVRTRWTRTDWTRQLLQVSIMLEMSSLFHVPSVMYCCAGWLMAVLLVYWIVARPPFRWNIFIILSLLYVGYFAVAILWSARPLRGAQFLIDNGLPLMGFALIASFSAFTRDEWTQVMKTFCYTALIGVGLALVSWIVSCCELHMSPLQWPILNKDEVGNIETYRWLFRYNGGLMGYAHPSYDLLPLFAATCIAFGLKKNKSIHPSIAWLLWAGCMVLALLTQSRMGLTYTFILLVFGILYSLPSLRSRLIIGSVIAVVGIAGLWGTWDQWKAYYSDPIRVQLYQYTWRYIELKPWSGAGTGALNPIEVCHTINESYWPHVGYIAPERDVCDWPWKAHMLPHNQWLADWSHAGIIAALITLLMYVGMIVECGRRRIYWGLAFMVIFIIFSCLEPPLYIGKGLYLFGALSMLVYANLKREQ